ncbi:MAG: hypothetical protein ABJB11_14950 [Ferruginibacter sp.]
MTLQGNLSVEFEGELYDLSVKSILLKGVYYFFISDHKAEHSFLSGETLELVYTDSFVTPEKSLPLLETVTPEKITAIKEMLQANKQLWFY